MRVYAVSDAFAKGLVKNAPSNDDEFGKLSARVAEELLRKNSEIYHDEGGCNTIELRSYQNKAVRGWVDNGFRGIFEMATGTGKTFTALGCVNRIRQQEQRLVLVIAAPYGHLVQQWKREIEKFGMTFDRQIVADSSNPSWRNFLADSLNDITLRYINTLLVLTTHSTFSCQDFCKIMDRNKGDFEMMLLADEVHGAGADKTQSGLMGCYGLRLGLSATPKRWFDELGTAILYDYFDDVVFEFSLENAINSINPDTNQT